MPVILATISNTPKATNAAPKNIPILLTVRMDFCLKDFEIIVYPMNKPTNHNNKKDLCIAPPKIVIAAKSI